MILMKYGKVILDLSSVIMVREYANLPKKTYMSHKEKKFYSPINFINA